MSDLYMSDMSNNDEDMQKYDRCVKELMMLGEKVRRLPGHDKVEIWRMLMGRLQNKVFGFQQMLDGRR